MISWYNILAWGNSTRSTSGWLRTLFPSTVALWIHICMGWCRGKSPDECPAYYPGDHYRGYISGAHPFIVKSLQHIWLKIIFHMGVPHLQMSCRDLEMMSTSGSFFANLYCTNSRVKGPFYYELMTQHPPSHSHHTPGGIKSLLEPMLTYQQRVPVTITCRQFHKRCSAISWRH